MNFSNPNPQQRAAIEWRGGHALVLAGAGTGKTFTIIERTKSLIEDGIDPTRIVMLTFTRRAAQEMRNRVGTKHHGLFAGTFHSWSMMLMHSRRDFPVRPEEWTIIDRDDQLQLMRRIKAYLTPKGEAKRFPTPAEVLKYIGFARSTLITPDAHLDRFTDLQGEQRQFVIDAAKHYHQHKQQRHYLDYDDILEVVAVSLTQDLDLACKIASQYDEVIIDEGQDLNPLQWKIIDALVPHTRIFMVGDDGQSIYAFRGADFESIHSFTKRIPGSKVLKLEENYRSGQGILDLANWVLDQSPLQYQKRLRGTRGEGTKPVLHHFSNIFDEANWITDTILAAHNNGEKFSTNKILVRMMSAGKQIEASLVEKNIPYAVIGGRGLFTLAHTKDFLSVVRATVNPRDELAWMRYLTLFEGIGEGTADRIVDKLLQCKSVQEARSIIEEGLKARARAVLAPIVAIGRNRTEPGEALRQALQAMKSVFERNYREDWKKRQPDMDLMISLAERRTDVVDFIETYTLDPIHGTQVRGSQEDKVMLITIHSAKGLEGRRVFIPQAQYGMYPFARSMGSAAEIEEERRILYVALTRSQDELLLSSGADGYRGFQTVGEASCFLEDVPKSIMDHVGQARASQRQALKLEELSEWGEVVESIDAGTWEYSIEDEIVRCLSDDGAGYDKQED